MFRFTRKPSSGSHSQQVRLTLSQATKALRKSRYIALLYFRPLHQKGVRGQRHDPAAPYPRERPGTHCTATASTQLKLHTWFNVDTQSSYRTLSVLWLHIVTCAVCVLCTVQAYTLTHCTVHTPHRSQYAAITLTTSCTSSTYPH